MPKATISIIIPVLNEADGILNLLRHLQLSYISSNIEEIIIVDGGSTDGTVEVLKQQVESSDAKASSALNRETLCQSKIKLIHSQKGRAIQMNAGAKAASGTILYFLHADTYPSKSFDQQIITATENRTDAGCFRMYFDTKNPFLIFFAWFTRFNWQICRGGDQSLFIKKTIFELVGGFNEAYRVYEDSEFTTRLYQQVTFKVLPTYVTTSARRYRQKGWLRLQYHFAVIHLKNYLGTTPDALHTYYKEHIN